MQRKSGRFVSVASVNVDNAYLKIAWELGYVVLALYVIGLPALFDNNQTVALALKTLGYDESEITAIIAYIDGTLEDVGLDQAVASSVGCLEPGHLVRVDVSAHHVVTDVLQ